MAANVGGAIEARDPEYLHQLRVGIRRLRTVLRVFKAKRLERRLRKLTKVLGEARDWDVFVGGRQGQGGARGAGTLPRSLSSAEFRAFSSRRSIGRGQSRARAARRFAAGALDRLHRKVLRRARAIDWRKPKRRHAVRIAVRRLRYGCDFFSPCFKDAARYLRGLSDLQDLLGDLNDIAVARRFGGPEAALDRRERALIRELAPAWHAFEKRLRFWDGR
jgi:CHAD domain-containing protein